VGLDEGDVHLDGDERSTEAREPDGQTVTPNRLERALGEAELAEVTGVEEADALSSDGAQAVLRGRVRAGPTSRAVSRSRNAGVSPAETRASRPKEQVQ
jgi:hypothetical protein